MNKTPKSMPLTLSLMNVGNSLAILVIITLTALAFRTSLVESIARGCIIVLLLSPLILCGANGFFAFFHLGIAVLIGMFTFGWLHHLIIVHNSILDSILLAWIPNLLWAMTVDHNYMEAYQIAIASIFGASLITTPSSLISSLVIILFHYIKGWPCGVVKQEDNHYWFPARHPR